MTLQDIMNEDTISRSHLIGVIKQHHDMMTSLQRNRLSVTEYKEQLIDIVKKEDKPGIDIIIKPGTKNESLHMPVILSQSGVQDMVYNDFYIGEDAVLEISGVEDQEVYIGIRPEGFILDENGPLHCQLSNVEIMGRDASIVSTNDAAISPVIRSIINADNKVDVTNQDVRFALKSHKVFIFNKETEERIYFKA